LKAAIIMYVTKGVKFNLNSPYQKELYDFCSQQSRNFSGFVKMVLFAYMQNFKQGVCLEQDQNTDDKIYIRDLL